MNSQRSSRLNADSAAVIDAAVRVASHRGTRHYRMTTAQVRRTGNEGSMLVMLIRPTHDKGGPESRAGRVQIFAPGLVFDADWSGVAKLGRLRVFRRGRWERRLLADTPPTDETDGRSKPAPVM